MSQSKMKLLLTVVFIAISTSLGEEVKVENVENQSCDTVFCSLGKECVMENKKPICACIEKCTGPFVPVCGSIGEKLNTYKSECHLYKESCERENVTVTLVANESCEKVKEDEDKKTEEIEKNVAKKKPVVCMEKHRDGVREAIIEYVNNKLKLEVVEVSYKGLLSKYFFSLDIDDDQMIDTREFMKLLEEDASMTAALHRESADNPILRVLCSTELIAITDVNSDYKLTFEEFYKCLDPNFEPPKEKCELSGVVYDDGADVPLECNNICKCACGHWVCTHHKCPESSQSNRVEDNLA